MKKKKDYYEKRRRGSRTFPSYQSAKDYEQCQNQLGRGKADHRRERTFYHVCIVNFMGKLHAFTFVKILCIETLSIII